MQTTSVSIPRSDNSGGTSKLDFGKKKGKGLQLISKGNNKV